MQISTQISNQTKILASNCNSIASDARCWYDPSNPCRSYKLHLNDAFERSVAFHLFFVVANHSTFQFSTVTYENIINSNSNVIENNKNINTKNNKNSNKSNENKVEILAFEQIIKNDREKFLNEEEQDNLKKLRLLQHSASNEKLGFFFYFCSTIILYY
jgi:hypothetical protein